MKTTTYILLAGLAGVASYMMRSSGAHLKPAKVNRNTKKKFAGGTRDLVDETSNESFPASDPPSWY